ncbi:hypothetical protein SSX86_013834 [Deinandra increscens subsp. villosa]|uniref:Laccase n=1 Tax=Deinandra increscens subsp. villosa TaxID=3103831 RepID=A0AAP0GYQ7_9ASTR
MLMKMKNLPLICRILLLLSFFMSLNSVAEARIRHYRWEVKYEFKSPDCFRKLVITVNGRSPGPTILAQQGDTIVVDLKNSLLTEDFAIHWHGIRQIRTDPRADGTQGAQFCILPGETFRYEFVADKAGTYLYHAHHEMQREAGLYGLIRVALPAGEAEPFSYDYERSIMLSDWYNRKEPDDPRSLLIQGRAGLNCNNATNPECSPYAITVFPQKTYRIRIGSVTTSPALSFEIEDHVMTVVEVGGNYVKPFTVSNLFIYSGETYSVLVTANQDPSKNYWVVTKVMKRNNTTPDGLAIFNYYPNPLKSPPPTLPPSGPLWTAIEPLVKHCLAVKSPCGYISGAQFLDWVRKTRDSVRFNSKITCRMDLQSDVELRIEIEFVILNSIRLEIRTKSQISDRIQPIGDGSKVVGGAVDVVEVAADGLKMEELGGGASELVKRKRGRPAKA